MTPQDFQIETGLSGQAVIQLLGVSPSSWYKWLAGEGEVPLYIKRAMQAHVDLIRLKRLITASAQGSHQWDRLTGGVSVYWPELVERMRGES